MKKCWRIFYSESQSYLQGLENPKYFSNSAMKTIFNLYQYMVIVHKSEVINRCILGFRLRALEEKSQSCQIALHSEGHLSQSHLPMKCTNMYLSIVVELPHTLQSPVSCLLSCQIAEECCTCPVIQQYGEDKISEREQGWVCDCRITGL